MSEPDEGIRKSRDCPPPSQAVDRDSFMDFDLDLDGSWPLDQISFVSNPMSPFLFSSSDQPCSPLWAFSDDADDKPSAIGVGGGLRLSECSRFLTCNPDLIPESRTENDEKRRLPPSVFTLTPIENPDGCCIIKERMTQALRYFKESTEQHVLAQSDGALRLPARVFRQKLPEWTPNVQYYSSREYSRLNHALHYNVRGTLALPVFEPSGPSCVGVLELIMTSQKINYAPEVDKVCKALELDFIICAAGAGCAFISSYGILTKFIELVYHNIAEAVNLKSSEILEHPKAQNQICNEGRQNALAEILEIFTVVCETYKLPLAQTWVPCRHRSVLAGGGGLRKSCSSFDGSCMGQVCMSTTDVAFYVVDAHMWGFREACAEHHLQKGQGVAGRAFESHNSCYCSNITQFCKTEYPLVHYARMFGLTCCFAICLRSTHTGNDDYILEFFLPPSITDSRDQQTLLDSLLATMKQHFQSLRVASGKEFEEEEKSVEIIKLPMNGKLDSRLESIQISQSTPSPPGPDILPSRGEMQQLDSTKHQLMVEFDAIKDRENVVGAGAAWNLRWPSRKINKVNRSLSKLKRVIESVQVSERAFGLTSLTSSPLPVAVGSISWPATLNGPYQQNSPGSKSAEPQGEKSGSPTCRTPGSDGQAETAAQFHEGGRSSHKELIHEQSGCLPELGKGATGSKTRSGSREESAGTPTSHGSCQGSPENETTSAKNHSNSPIYDQCEKAVGGLESAFQPRELSLSAAFSIPEALITTEPQTHFGGMLIEDAGSSKDLRNLCPSVADAMLDERVPESSWTNPPCSDIPPKHTMNAVAHTIPQITARPDVRTMTIKATYRDDIIRFRIPLTSGIVELKEEVAKRLKLEVGTFDIKYLDDDHEWVLIACNADLQECMDISWTTGSNIIRLLVQDLMTNLGSSCESTGE
ncbi:Protein NLP7 [Vitis vinifera]|uniref:Protein NLP7 n=1 Tax=Vitis vinifera TaxID=29760 RepID=A0A438BV61_VITVI|nr:Protein NLP7 [Vitis vinifera]